MSNQQPNIRFLNPPTIHPPRGYSHVVEVTGGRTVYIAGQVAIDPQGNMVGVGDMRAQTIQVFENIKAALDAVGATFDHVVKVTYYIVDMTQVPVMREVRDLYLNTQAPPASTAIAVPRLFRPEVLIEVEAVAVIP